MEGAYGKDAELEMWRESGNRKRAFFWTLYKMKIIAYYLRGFVVREFLFAPRPQILQFSDTNQVSIIQF